MKQRDQIRNLELLAQLAFEQKLAEVKKAALARQRSLDGLASLDVPPATELDPLTAAQVDLRYQAWADRRRGDINVTLSRQTAEWSEKMDLARQAFSRCEVLRLLRSRNR